MNESHILTSKGSNFVLRIIFAVLAFGFIIYLLIKTFQQIDLEALTFDISNLSISLLLLVGYLFIINLIYFYITQNIGFPLSLLKVMKIRALSDFGRYIPGKIWFVGGRLYLFGKEGMGSLKVILSIYLELVLNILSGFTLSLFFLSNNIFDIKLQILLPIFIILVLLFLRKKNIIFVINFIARIIKKEKLDTSGLQYYMILKTFILYLIAWGIFFLAFYFFTAAFIIIPIEKIGILGASMAMAWLLGFLVFLVPAGLGVREGSLYYLLSLEMATKYASIIAVLSRIWFLLGELGVLLIIYLFNYVSQRKKI